MRLTLVGDHPPPYGGISIHVQQLHRFLLGAGVNANVLDIGKGKTQAPGVVGAHSWAEFAWHLQRLIRSAVLVHAHVSGNNSKAWAVAASLSAGRGPRMLTVHSGLFPAFASASARNRLLVRGSTQGYNKVVAVSAAVKEALFGCGVSDQKLVLMPAFLGSQVVPGELPVGFVEARARRQPLLAYAHHPSPVYGRPSIFKALRLLRSAYPEVGLLVMGPGTKSPEFERDARHFQVEGLIENLGEVPHASALAAVAKSDAFLRPTLADGDALSVREALALGVPTVASDASVRPEGTVVFPAGNERALCEAVVKGLSQKPTAGVPLDCGPSLLEMYRMLSNEKGEEHRAAF